MKREPDIHKAPLVREGDSLVRKFLRTCQNRRCTEALSHLLRAWPVYSTMTFEYEELQDSLKMARTGARWKPAPGQGVLSDLKALGSLVLRAEGKAKGA